MDLRRRFIFHGNAAAIGGRIVRPADVMIDSPVSSSLTVVGGRTHAQAGPTLHRNARQFKPIYAVWRIRHVDVREQQRNRCAIL